MYARLILNALILLMFVSAAHAGIKDVVRSKEEFTKAPVTYNYGVPNVSYEDTKTVRVKGARVVMADYDLIAQDFPEMRQQPNESVEAWKGRIDAALESETPFILEEQAKQTVVNTEIQVTSETKDAFRPKGYNRADVFKFLSGLMDRKGSGTKSPKKGPKGDGLASLGEMIREFLMEKLVSAIFDNAGVNIRTVGCYAVMDYGFDMIHDDGSKSRAGYVLRQAHKRSEGFNSGHSKEDAFAVEKVLRNYGITSSGELYAMRLNDFTGTYNYDYTNIQGTNNTRTIEIIDFGAFLGVERFKHRLVSHKQYQPLMELHDPKFIQPDPAHRASMEQWGNLGVNDSKADKPWIWSHQLAQAWAEGRANRAAVDTHLHNMLDGFLSRSPSRRCEHVFASQFNYFKF